jgi:hypothetical protein
MKYGEYRHLYTLINGQSKEQGIIWILLVASVYQIAKEPRVPGSENILIAQDYQDVGGM